MIKMRMRYQNEIDVGQFMQMEARMANPFDDFQPARPVWVDQDIQTRRLNQKRGVPDPRDANFPVTQRRKRHGLPGSLTFCE